MGETPTSGESSTRFVSLIYKWLFLSSYDRKQVLLARYSSCMPRYNWDFAPSPTEDWFVVKGEAEEETKDGDRKR